MKKLLLLTTFIPSIAMAETASVVLNPYIGIDLQRTVYSYNDNYSVGAGSFLDGDIILDDSLNGFSIHIGTRLQKNFGIELGYFNNREESKSVTAGQIVGPGTVATTSFSTDVKTSGFTLDVLGYIPANDSFELIGTVGASWTDAEISLSVPGVGIAAADEDEFGYRVGIGAQYNMTDNVNLRAIARYQSADFNNIADRAWVYSAGFNYSF